MRMKRFYSLLAALMLLAASALPVFAAGESSASEASSAASSASSASAASSVAGAGKEYIIPELQITVSIPKSMYVFQKDQFSFSDPELSKAGITDINAFAEKFSKYNLLLDAISEDASLEVGFYKKESDETRSYHNLGELTEEEYAEFLKKMQPSKEYQEENNIKMEVESYDHPQTRFFITRIEMDKSESYDHSISEVCYATIVNGYTVTVDAVVLDAKISAEQEALVREIVDSIRVSKFIDKSETEALAKSLTTQDYFTIYGALLLIVGVVVALIFSHRSRKRRERERRLLADRLSQYRFEEQEKRDAAAKEGRSPEEPETLFRNRTDYTEAAVRGFVSYHLRRRRLMSFILYTLAALVFIFFAAFSNMDVIMRLLLIGLAVFILVWECLVPGKLLKAQSALLRSAIHKWNEYSFRKRDFRVTGIQSSTLYPYFQITHLGENKDYFFLYFGEETAYYVEKSGFTQGEADAFRSFILERMKQA